jgi:SsrA-binding protein
MSDNSSTPVIQNRKVRHDYEILETLEAGLVLHGPEVKSVREGRVSLRDAHVTFEGDQAFLVGMSIAEYANARMDEQHPHRPRKLLMHRREIKRWARKSFEKGYTVVPLKVYFNDRGYAKVQIALARGKRQYDKRRTIAEREEKRRMDRIKKEINRG